MLFLLISILAGILTILAPCVLPAIPIIIGGSIGGNHKARPYIVGISLALSIILFTLILKVSTVLIDLPPSALNYLSGGILILLGVAAAFPQVWEWFVIRFNWQAKADKLLGKASKSGGAILTGVALGPVFASCSPTYAFILASVLPRSFLSGLIYLVAYTVGLAAALLFVSLVGRNVIKKYRWAIDTHSVFRRALGALFVIIGIVVFIGLQVKVETWIANHLPFDESKIEQVLLASQNQNSIVQKIVKSATDPSVLNVQPTPAPALKGLSSWINSPPQTIAGLKGKVVLVDFWTYSCINCIRTLPYIEKWYQTYEKDGFEVIGVNTPEFAFEHKASNVQQAVTAHGLTYPVALDNNYDTWNAYDNESWPADYLIDQNGDIRYVAIGEGDYSTTEKAIQQLLSLDQPLVTPSDASVPVTNAQTPETYFGTEKASDYEGTPDIDDSNATTASFTATSSLDENDWTLNGTWDTAPSMITSDTNSSTLTFRVEAKDSYVIATPAAGETQSLGVKLSSNSIGTYASDDPGGVVSVDQERLYHIVTGNTFGDSTVTLTVPKGMSLYTFTFGS